jgi:hypothetical protein
LSLGLRLPGMNMLLKGDDVVRAAPEDDTVIMAAGGTLRLGVLPVLLFANGHVAFVQRLPDRWVTPLAASLRACLCVPPTPKPHGPP